MTEREAIKILISSRDYLCDGNPTWRTEPIHDAVNMAVDALRKTENSSEKLNNSTRSKMEQVDKDINVRSKDEPQTDCKRCRHFATDICHECYGNELFDESGYITELTNTPQTEREGE